MPDDDVPADVRAALTVMANPQPMRRGSLGGRFMKCGKPACGCHSDPRRSARTILRADTRRATHDTVALPHPAAGGAGPRAGGEGY